MQIYHKNKKHLKKTVSQSLTLPPGVGGGTHQRNGMVRTPPPSILQVFGQAKNGQMEIRTGRMAGSVMREQETILLGARSKLKIFFPIGAHKIPEW